MRKVIYDVTKKDGTEFTTTDFCVVRPILESYEGTCVTRYEEVYLKDESKIWEDGSSEEIEDKQED